MKFDFFGHLAFCVDLAGLMMILAGLWALADF